MDVFKRFWVRYATPHLKSYGLGLVFLLATTGLTVAIPGFVELAVDAMEEGASSEAIAWAWAIIVAGFGVMVVRTLSRILFFNPGREIEYHLKNDLFGHLTRLPRRYFDRMRPGEIISRGTNDAAAVRGFIGFGSLQIGNVALTLVLALSQMLLMNPLMTLLCVSPLLLAVLVLRVAVKQMFGFAYRNQSQVATLSERILETYNGATVLQSYNAMQGARARFDQANDELLDIAMGLVKVRAWLLPVVTVVGNLCLVILLYAGGRMVIEGDLSKGELAAFAVYIRIVVSGLTSLGWLINAVQRGWISLGRVYEVLDAPQRAADGDRPLPARTGAGRSLEVRQLTFSYPESEGEGGPALEGLDFRVQGGETLGIFGLTGAGKTTLLNLLGRIYDPPAGTVCLDGQDVRELDLEAYWKALAYVPQDAFLFSQSIRDNIALSAPAGERDDERVRAAAEAAALIDDLDALPEGLDTQVGQRGITLSGGQRQRSALARAFYREFEVLLLDDVLSAVDHATEKRLIEAIYARAQGGTTLVVSHRISVLKRAHRILVLDGGRMVAQGTHEELVARGVEPYLHTWKLQQAREREESEGIAGGVDG